MYAPRNSSIFRSCQWANVAFAPMHIQLVIEFLLYSAMTDMKYGGYAINK